MKLNGSTIISNGASSLVFFCLLLLSISCSQSQDSNASTSPPAPTKTLEPDPPLERIGSYEAFYKQDFAIGSEVEVFELNWSADDRLCDRGYCASYGETNYMVFRLKNSNRIIKVSEDGSTACQGDSEYGYHYLFDKNGFAIYSVEGGNIYSPTTVKFYDSGKEIVKVEYSAGNEEERIREITNTTSTEVISATDFEWRITELKETIKNRIFQLERCEWEDVEDVAELKKEAQETIKTLQETISKGTFYTGGYVIRKPKPIENGEYGEGARIIGTNVRVRKEPNTESEILAKVSYYDIGFRITAISPAETIKPYGRHNWYKVQNDEMGSWNEIEGWIFGAFIAADVFPEE